jgi:hypothetical protein
VLIQGALDEADWLALQMLEDHAVPAIFAP